MMHPMLTGSVEDVFKGSKLRHSLSMNPVLIEGVVLTVNKIETRREEEGQRQIIYPLNELMKR